MSMSKLLHRPLCVGALLLLLAAPLGATEIILINLDGPTEGFNDPTPVAPLPGNPGTTLGQQRLIAFQAVLDQLEGVVQSDVPIRLLGRFNPVGDPPWFVCGILGYSGATTVFANFPNAPHADTYYSAALADAIAGYDITGAYYDIQSTFNSDYDTGVCGSPPNTNWYYGLDGNPGASQQHLYPVLLHEVIHGLGFQSFVDEASGSYLNGPNGPLPDVWCHYLYDTTVGLHWNNEMTNGQRQASAINTGNLVWDGAITVAAAESYLHGGNMDFEVNSPPAIAGIYAAYGALFGPSHPADWTGELELVNDGTAYPTCGCEPLIGFTPGNIAFIDRGPLPPGTACEFGLKALNAQNAGASAVIIANHSNGTELVRMSGGVFGDQVNIPVVAVSQNTGNTVKPYLTPTGVNSTQRVLNRWGAKPTGEPLIYNPNPVEPGSSISHWSWSIDGLLTLSPASIMSPFADPADFNRIDLTDDLFQDIGWQLQDLFSDGFESGDASAWSSVVP